MLQAPSHLSKDYGHGHIKKFWLMQTLKESENKALLASSSSSFSRHGTSSAGKGHESKHSPQLSSGNTTARTLSAGTSSPSGLPVRPLLTGPGCFGSVTARHASLVTCAESLSPPLRSDHSRILSRPSSRNISASNLKEENDLLAEDADCSPFKSPPRGSDLSASSSRCGSPLVSSSDDTGLAGNAAYEHEPLKATIFYHGSVHDHSSSGKDSHQDDAFLQGSCDRVKCSDSTRSESHSLEACNTSDPGKGYNSDLGNFDSLASPLLPSRKGLLEKKVKHFDGKSSGRVWVWSAAVPLLSKRGLEKGEACRAEIPASKCDVSSEVRGNVMRICSLCGTSKTPLWRSGPQGPKSLCNACGIRFKKSKRCSGPSESPDRLVSPLASRDSTMVSSRPPKRKQETQFLSTEAHWPRDPGSEVVTAGVTSQQAKKSRWSKLMLKGEVVRHRGEVTGSSGESCLTWNLHSPSSVSLPSVKVFDKLATEEKHRSVNSVVGKDEEEAAALLMYLSCGLVYA